MKTTPGNINIRSSCHPNCYICDEYGDILHDSLSDSLFNIPTDTRLNHRIEVISGVMAKESVELMQLFFRQVRNNKGNVK